MFVGQNNNQQQNRNRVRALIERVQNAYNNTNKIKRFINIVLLVSMIPSFFLLVQLSLYLSLVNYFFKPRENGKRLSAWPKNVIRMTLSIFLIIHIINSCVLLVLPILCLWLLNKSLIEEIRQFNDLIQQIPEEERPIFFQDLAATPFMAQTTHGPGAVASINLSVDRLIEKRI